MPPIPLGEVKDYEWQRAYDVVSDALRVGLKPPDNLTVTEWAERNLVLSPRSTNYPGKFKASRSPYIREPIDSFSDPFVRRVSICSAAQVAKTTAILTCIGYAIDQDPSPTLLVLPNAILCRSLSEQRLQPLIEDCEALAKHIPEDKKKFRLQEMFLSRMTLALVGSNSPANLASRPVRYLLLDEVDKYPGASKREAGAVDLAMKRTLTFWNRTIVMTSTPTTDTGEIWRAYLDGDQRAFYVPCPHCGHSQPLVLDASRSVVAKLHKWDTVGGLKWDQSAKRDDGSWDLDKVRDSTYYECGLCKGKIEHKHKLKMVANGRWVPHAENKHHRSYQISALYPTWVKWGDVAVEMIKASSSPDQMRDFVNSLLGEPWEEYKETVEIDQVMEHRKPYQLGTVPFKPTSIIISADVQKDSIYYVVRAWGQFEKSALVAYGQCVSFDALDQVSRHEYRGIDDDKDKVYMASEGVIDSGDQTDDVYSFCDRTGFIPVKGFDTSQRKSPRPYQWTKQPGGQNLLSVNSSYYKDSLQTRLRMSTESVSGWWLASDTQADYAEQICGEVKTEETDKNGRPVYKWKKVGDNHLLDCEVYQLAAAAVFGVGGSTDFVKSRATTMEGVPSDRRGGGDWITRGRDGKN